MLPTPEFLRRRLEQVIACKAAQGHDTAGLLTELKHLPDRYDDLAGLAQRLRNLPLLNLFALRCQIHESRRPRTIQISPEQCAKAAQRSR